MQHFRLFFFKVENWPLVVVGRVHFQSSRFERRARAHDRPWPGPCPVPLPRAAAPLAWSPDRFWTGPRPAAARTAPLAWSPDRFWTGPRPAPTRCSVSSARSSTQVSFVLRIVFRSQEIQTRYTTESQGDAATGAVCVCDVLRYRAQNMHAWKLVFHVSVFHVLFWAVTQGLLHVQHCLFLRFCVALPGLCSGCVRVSCVESNQRTLFLRVKLAT